MSMLTNDLGSYYASYILIEVIITSNSITLVLEFNHSVKSNKQNGHTIVVHTSCITF